MMEGLLREIDFGRLQPGHLPNVEALCRQRLGQAATAAIRRQLGGDSALDRLSKELAEELLCTRVFFAMLQDEGVTSILAVGTDRLEVERGAQRESIEGVFPSEESLQRVALWMTARAGRPVHAGDPIVRTRLPDGSELQAILPPLAPGGCLLSVRRPALGFGDLAGLALQGVVPSGLLPVLHAMVSARLTIVVAGASEELRGGVADALLSAAPADERVVVLDPQGTIGAGRPTAIRLRPGEAASYAVLLAAAARLQPERIVVRGLDASTTPGFLRLAAGHAEGSIATMDACAPRDAVDRLVAQSAREIGEAAAARLVASAVSAVLFLGWRSDGRPVLEALSEVATGDGDRIALHDLVRFHPRPDGGGTFTGSGTRPTFAELLDRRGHRLPATTWRFQQSVS